MDYAEASEANPLLEQAVVLHDQARSYYEQGEYHKAIDKLLEAVRLDPNGTELYYNLGLIYEKLGNLTEAERHYRRYVELETDAKARQRVEAILMRLQGAREEFTHSATPKVSASSQGHKSQGGSGVSTTSEMPWYWVTGGVTVLAAASTVVFGTLAVTQSPSNFATTNDTTSAKSIHDDAYRAHSWAVVADVSLVVALMSGTATLVGFLNSPNPKRTSCTPFKSVQW